MWVWGLISWDSAQTEMLGNRSQCQALKWKVLQRQQAFASQSALQGGCRDPFPGSAEQSKELLLVELRLLCNCSAAADRNSSC